ncbi:MAG: PMT family glycosyltransferase, 4-amino-4-deoxy-L-arabinose transferase [Solidesulfovibrio magneticus str. Maddingley MBC34]|uniref:PMT family glycosyltransferase, 4-amino-4-deoxy-L-arabinose transferase n=1 Tax=Solidesulfovibrio magneticus str. Maddingley MBC34 TaxID=1206767 RepID=K6GVY8_9BACT|nr:MAG: PMT family glycosyltransferase, 4-amino-4-deoxy-L-arabinose transferase [Solidesulfovibrio magneticus str. Maddingley MBC34]
MTHTSTSAGPVPAAPPAAPATAGFRFDWGLAAVLAAAAFLLFFHLGQRPFWQDEAETACLAKNVLVHGLPYSFDGLNVVSQEEEREFDKVGGYLWRWSPWMQIYLQAAGFAVGGLDAAAGRVPFALAALVAVYWLYRLVRRHFGDRDLALLAAILLTTCVPFLLIGRQARYYAPGTLFVLWTLDAFLSDWQRKTLPLLAMFAGMALLFHANYLLFLSFAPTALAAAFLVYPEKFHWKRLGWLVAATVALVMVPGILLYRIGSQSGMFDVLLVPENLMLYFADLCMFCLPMPVSAYLVWRWRRFATRGERPADSAERFALFSAVLIVFSLLFLGLVPQRFFRYIAHLLPLCAFLLAFCVRRLWNFSKISAVLLFFLLAATNWLAVYPMERLKIVNRPWQNDFRMLTSNNFPLKLFLTELACGYPDVNAAIVGFFAANAKPGQTIVAEYGDLPLQFALSGVRVLGGLQGPIPEGVKPDWVLRRRVVRVNRDRFLFGTREFTDGLNYERDYERVPVPFPDETFGNRTDDPNHHYFIAVEPPQKELEIWRRREGAS